MTRLLTGLTTGGLWLCIVYSGSYIFLWIVLSAIAVLALREYYRICLTESEQGYRTAGIVTGLIPLLCCLCRDVGLTGGGFVLSIICLIILVLFRAKDTENPFLLMAKLNFGTTYIGLCATYLLLLFSLPNGQFWLVLLSIIIVFSDSGAYYFGSTFGRTKLCPTISPGKTVEGFLGGLLLAAVSAAVFTKLAAPDPEIDIIRIVFLSLFLGCVGVVGDLTESMIKRANYIKDSGSILPGHGGVLDRIDSILLTAPILFYIRYLDLFL